MRFGRFEFDPEEGALTRDGVAVRLQPQPARVLALLVERAGQLVTRDELRQRIWGDRPPKPWLRRKHRDAYRKPAISNGLAARGPAASLRISLRW